MNDIERRDFIELMWEGSQNLYALLENLLTWSRINSGKIVYNPEETDLVCVIKNSIAMNKANAAGKKISLVQKTPECLSCMIDGNMMATVIRNLISNAIKFTPDEGTITVSAKRPEDSSLEIRVADNGIGMSQEAMDKLFKIGSATTTRGTNNEVGTGLGLILCHEFIEKHGGTIRVESEIGKGSEFIITIPQK